MDTLGFAVIATGVILFGLVSKRLESTVVTPPMIFAGFGLIVGDAVLGMADLDFGHGFIHGLAELTLILVLFSDAARIDLRQLRKDHNLPVRMLVVGMPLTIAAGTVVALLLPLGLGLWEAALLAAILAPTDAALGQSVVSPRPTPRSGVLGVALLAYSSAEIIDGNGFIAAFVGGLIFGNFVRNRCDFVFEFAEAEGQLLVMLTFLIFGAAILPQSFGAIDWMIVLYATLSLTVIRMLPVAVSLIGAGARRPTVAFLGWFGPRGLASMLFALFVLEEITTAAGQVILVITVVTVALSILAHGLTAAPLARRYGALTARMGEGEETKVVSEMPTRARIRRRGG